ncbi:MAG: cystathionine beta-synthase [Chloroflexi bacterium]|nr:MAG: cystathionine beta-synthase [Chloroflexota bacterium]MBL1196553.1 cystathionine beta-synthase [Chloroflexota bacterium]NOH13848.1 cystathionine beta-synthase [Chloroflexota bacterium]
MGITGLPESETLRVYDNVISAIGKTPLIRLSNIGRELPAPLYAKVEYFNPGGSVKDRIALNIIEEAEQSGRLKPGGTIVEATSGNTGVGLAIVCALKGYKAIFVMPDKMSQEKIQLLRAYGARVVMTPTSVAPEDPRSYYNVADRLVAETSNSVLANQYHNPENPRSHYETTGPEIWEQTGGKVTDVVIGMGTGGTISGVGKYLKEKNPDIRIVGVDATGSILKEIWENEGVITDEMIAETYKVEGIGEDFLPSTTDLSVVDDIVRVTDKESFLWTRRLVQREGIFAGGSCGSALYGAILYMEKENMEEDRLVVVLLPDSGSRYLSKIFDDKWMRENGYLEAEWQEMSLAEVLGTKVQHELITATVDEAMADVVDKMKAHNISQVPALNTDGSLAGLVREVDLLTHMLEVEHNHSDDETITSIVQPVNESFPSNTHLQDVMPALVKNNVVMVKDDDRLVGILSKIDVIDLIYQ